MKITSPAFADKIPVPVQYTCKGENVSPPLEFIDVPKEAKSLVLIVEDSDSADKRVHWLVYNIPGSCTHFNEGKSSKDAMQGICSDGAMSQTIQGHPSFFIPVNRT
jgi:Raf kinase inhibitor-like YbhB/YbcL family protein